MRAAQLLGLTFRSLRYRLAKHGLGVETTHEAAPPGHVGLAGHGDGGADLAIFAAAPGARAGAPWQQLSVALLALDFGLATVLTYLVLRSTIGRPISRIETTVRSWPATTKNLAACCFGRSGFAAAGAGPQRGAATQPVAPRRADRVAPRPRQASGRAGRQ